MRTFGLICCCGSRVCNLLRFAISLSSVADYCTTKPHAAHHNNWNPVAHPVPSKKRTSQTRSISHQQFTCSHGQLDLEIEPIRQCKRAIKTKTVWMAWMCELTGSSHEPTTVEVRLRRTLQCRVRGFKAPKHGASRKTPIKCLVRFLFSPTLQPHATTRAAAANTIVFLVLLWHGLPGVSSE